MKGRITNETNTQTKTQKPLEMKARGSYKYWPDRFLYKIEFTIL